MSGSDGIGGQIRKFFRDSSIYGFGIAFNRFMSFIVLPLITAKLVPAELGVLTLLQVFASILLIFLNAGVQQAINRNYYDNETAEHRAAVIGTGLLWRLVLTVTICGGLWIAAGPMTGLIVGERTATTELFYLLTLANVVAQAPQGIAYTLYRMRLQAGRNTLFSIGGSFVSTLFLVALLWIWPRGIRGALEAAIIGNLIVTLAMLPDVLRAAKLRWRNDVFRGILSYGLPFLPHHLAMYLLFGANRYFLEHYRTMTEVGLFSYAYRIGQIMTLVLEGASMAWTPFLFSLINRDDARTIHAHTARYILAAIVGAGVGIIAFGPELTVFLARSSPDYWSAAYLVPWIVGGYVFLGVYQVFSAAVGIPKRTRLLPVFSLIGLVANLALNALLVPRWGMRGAAAATLVSYGIMGIVTAIVSQRVYPVPYDWRRIATIGVAGIVPISLSFFVPDWSLGFRIVARAGCVLLYPALLLVLGFLRAEEWRLVLRIFIRKSEVPQESVRAR